MDDKLVEFYSLKPLMSEIATLREHKHYQKILKQTYRAEMENLRNVEIELYKQKPKLSDPSKWPLANDLPLPEVDVQKPLEEYNNILAALNCLK